jgi:hypothetical protein
MMIGLLPYNIDTGRGVITSSSRAHVPITSTKLNLTCLRRTISTLVNQISSCAGDSVTLWFCMSGAPRQYSTKVIRSQKLISDSLCRLQQEMDARAIQCPPRLFMSKAMAVYGPRRNLVGWIYSEREPRVWGTLHSESRRPFHSKNAEFQTWLETARAP